MLSRIVEALLVGAAYQALSAPWTAPLVVFAACDVFSAYTRARP